jgi:hypothetical protein
LKLCALCAKLLRPQVLEETEHFRHWRYEEVAKIVQCGEHLFLNERIRGHLQGGLNYFVFVTVQFDFKG